MSKVSQAVCGLIVEIARVSSRRAIEPPRALHSHQRRGRGVCELQRALHPFMIAHVRCFICAIVALGLSEASSQIFLTFQF